MPTTNETFYFFTNCGLYYWFIKDFDGHLFLIKLDFGTTLKVGLNREWGIFYFNIDKKISLLTLEEINNKFNTVIELLDIDFIQLEKGRSMQNKLTIETAKSTYSLYMIDRHETNRLEAMIKMLLPANFTVKNKGHV